MQPQHKMATVATEAMIVGAVPFDNHILFSGSAFPRSGAFVDVRATVALDPDNRKEVAGRTWLGGVLTIWPLGALAVGCGAPRGDDVDAVAAMGTRPGDMAAVGAATTGDPGVGTGVIGTDDTGAIVAEGATDVGVAGTWFVNLVVAGVATV